MYMLEEKCLRKRTMEICDCIRRGVVRGGNVEIIYFEKRGNGKHVVVVAGDGDDDDD